MRRLESIDDIRRKAPLHFWQRSNNARAAAWALWSLPEGSIPFDEQIGYDGTPRVALYEGFRREAAISIELVIKAVIARQLELGCAKGSTSEVPQSHDIPKLWDVANLPKLDLSGRRLLVSVKWILIWSGRYPAPTNDRSRIQQEAEFDALAPPFKGTFRIQKIQGFGWPEFEILWKPAASKFWELWPD
jgi:hypothetical protein